MQPDDVRQLLDRSLETPAPPSSASVATAIIQGRRYQRHRRFAVAGSGLAVLALVAAGTVAVLHLYNPGPAATPTGDSSVALASLDPLVTHVRPGWLPPDLTPLGVSSSRQQFGVNYRYPPGPGQATDGPALSVTVSTSEPDTGSVRVVRPSASMYIGPSPWPPAPARTPPRLTATAPVDGHPANWVEPSGPSSATLRWENGSGLWAEVHADSLRGGLDAQQTVRRVADGLTIGSYEPVLGPLQLAHLPAGATVSGIDVTRQGDDARPWEATLRLAATGASITVYVYPAPNCVCGGKYDQVTNTTVNGLPAWRNDIVHNGIVVYFPGRIVGDITVEPTSAGQTDMSQAVATATAPLGLVGFAGELSVYPDQADWRVPVAG